MKQSKSTSQKKESHIWWDVVPGKVHWIGYTTLREGIVLSDELLMSRAITLNSKELGSLPSFATRVHTAEHYASDSAIDRMKPIQHRQSFWCGWPIDVKIFLTRGGIENLLLSY